MSTVDKALSLLGRFDSATPEIGLSEMAKAAGFDKATTRRLLVALAGRELVEQDPVSRRYRLGPAVVRLARLREEAFPLAEVARPVVDELSADIGETVHVTELSGTRLTTVYVRESSRAIRVSVDVGESLPFHCTASGFAVLAFGSDSLRREIFARPMAAMTPHSLTTVRALQAQIDAGRKKGYTTCDQGYEEGVYSVAAPILAAPDRLFGAISIASPTSRVDRKMIESHGRAVTAAAARLAAALGARSGARNL